MKFGCCMGLATFVVPSTSRSLVLKSLSFQEKLEKIPFIMETLEKNGFDFVEAEVSLVSPEGEVKDYEGFKEKMRPFSIKPEVFSAFIPPEIKVVGPNVNTERLRRYLAISISRVSEMGGETIIWGSGASRSCPKDFPLEEADRQLQDFLHLAADLAKDNGICLAIEPMNKGESNILNSLREVLTLCEKLDRREINAMLDFYHLMMEKEELSIIEYCREKIIHVHLSDRERKCPGDGDYPFTNLFTMLKKVGYESRISLECNFQNFGQESKRGLEFVRGVWDKTMKWSD